MATEQSTAPVAKSLVYRLLLSLLAGLVVFGLSVAAAYQTYRDSAIRGPQRATLHSIAATAEAVEAYRAAHHALPRELKGLEPAGAHVDEQGNPLDYWRRPLHYRTEGTRYRITSYGYDGRPGGVGLDHDLTSHESGKDGKAWPQPPPQTAPTFRQFATDWTRLGAIPGSSLHGSGGAMFVPCVLAGVLAFVLSYRTLGGTTRPHQRPLRLVASLAGTVVAALFVGLVMAMFEVPSGH